MKRITNVGDSVTNKRLTVVNDIDYDLASPSLEGKSHGGSLIYVADERNRTSRHKTSIFNRTISPGMKIKWKNK